MSEGWTFLVELCGDPPLAEHCTCLVDLSEEDDRGDIEVFKDQDGILHCTLGCVCDEDGAETREINLGLIEGQPSLKKKVNCWNT